MFGERPLFDCLKKADPTVALRIVSWLGCNRESALHFADTEYILYLEIMM
jgi:hypothetical protein